MKAGFTKLKLRRLLSNLVFWCGMFLVGVIAVPAGICYILISLLIKLTDLTVNRINGRG